MAPLTSRVSYHEIPVYVGNQVDVLFVVDDSPAMAPYEGRIAALAGELEQAYGRYNLHLAVASNDGRLRTPPSIGGPFLAYTPKTFSPAVTNFEGTLGNATAALLAVGTGGAGTATPLSAMQRALAPAGFFREYAPLEIITIAASDDASPISVADAVAGLHALDREIIYTSAVYPRPAPRLDELQAQFQANAYTAIDAPDYGTALSAFQFSWTTLGAACFEQPADVDPDAAGAQYDCSITAVEDGLEHVLPRCGGGEALCWDVVADPQVCTAPGELRFVTRGPFVGAITIRAQCVD